MTVIGVVPVVFNKKCLGPNCAMVLYWTQDGNSKRNEYLTSNYCYVCDLERRRIGQG